MNFQKLKSKNSCSASAAALMLDAHVAAVEGQDVLGIGVGIPLIWTGLIIFAISLALLMICTLFEWFTNWLLKKKKN